MLGLVRFQGVYKHDSVEQDTWISLVGVPVSILLA